MISFSNRSTQDQTSAASHAVTLWLRASAWGMVALVLLFLLNNFLIFWWDWPGVLALSAHQGWFGLSPLSKPVIDEAITLGWTSLPTFNPNNVKGANPEHFRNNVTQSVYELGSTFKPLTMAFEIRRASRRERV